MECSDVRFSQHAFERLAARGIAPACVVRTIREGEIIETYTDDHPFPTFLLLGFIEEGPVHVLVARDLDSGLCIVVTAYIPDRTRWSEGFKTRRTL